MATQQRGPDPFRAFNFIVEINGVPRGGFSEVSGLTADGDAVDYREGTDGAGGVRKLPGLRKNGTITLKRGMTTDKTLWQLYAKVLNGDADIRRTVTVILLNERREAALTWVAENAWVNKIEGPALKANGNEVAMESVEFVHEGLTLEA